MLWPKNISYKEYVLTKKIPAARKLPILDNFSHGPSLNNKVLEYLMASRFVRPQPRTKFFFLKRSLSRNGSALWNSLSLKVRFVSSN